MANADSRMAIVASALLFGFIFIGEKHTIQRWQGWTFIAVYIGYAVFVVMRRWVKKNSLIVKDPKIIVAFCF
ncbi:MAG TPA: hypothetical protein VEC36_06320 [Patescibacteria group bacterium]|nr:hypothetical protein [Patescibacteria group bacterium]